MLRETLIWVGFALLLGASVITVALPELADEPEADEDSSEGDHELRADAGTP